MHRRPLEKWTAAALALTLNGFPVLGSDTSFVWPPTASAANQLRNATGASKPLLHVLPDRAAAFVGHRFAPFLSTELPADYAWALVEPARPMEEQLQAMTRGSSSLVSVPIGTGRFNLIWHGANLSARLRFDDSPTQPSVELTGGGARKIKLTVTLHW